jgi:hypothetical protein
MSLSYTKCVHFKVSNVIVRVDFLVSRHIYMYMSCTMREGGRGGKGHLTSGIRGTGWGGGGGLPTALFPVLSRPDQWSLTKN